MINAIFVKKSDNIIGFEISGHSGYSDRGTDIYCASVSALVINTINSIEEFTEDDFESFADEEDGILGLNFKSNPSESSRLLVNSLELGLKYISESCEGKYLKIEYKEV